MELKPSIIKQVKSNNKIYYILHNQNFRINQLETYKKLAFLLCKEGSLSVFLIVSCTPSGHFNRIILLAPGA